MTEQEQEWVKPLFDAIREVSYKDWVFDLGTIPCPFLQIVEQLGWMQWLNFRRKKI